MITEDKIKLSKKNREIIHKIQDMYVQNLAFFHNPSFLKAKKMVKNCNDINKLFVPFEKFHCLIGFKFLERQIIEFEDYIYRSKNYLPADHLYARYEDVQVTIHNYLRYIGYDDCLDHGINLHYCSKCKSKFGVGERGDE